MTPLVWLEPSPGFYRSDSGRFDLMLTDAGWVAYDFDRPRRLAAGTATEAMRWCEGRREADVAKKPKDDEYEYRIRRYVLRGRKVGGVYEFFCDSFPGLAERYPAETDATRIAAEFERLVAEAEAKAKAKGAA